MSATEATAANLARHEAVCAERYENLRSDIADLKESLSALWTRVWAFVGVLLSVEMAVAGWALARLLDR